MREVVWLRSWLLAMQLKYGGQRAHFGGSGRPTRRCGVAEANGRLYRLGDCHGVAIGGCCRARGTVEA